MLVLLRPRASLSLLRQGVQGSLVGSRLQPPGRSLRQAVRCCAARAVGSTGGVHGGGAQEKPPAAGDGSRSGGGSEAYRYGLHGGFGGDTEKLARATAAADALARGELPSIPELVAVLASLPQGGRWEFIGRAIMQSPCGAEVALALFEDCFKDVEADGGGCDDDDEFIPDDAPSLPSVEKRFILTALLERMPADSPALAVLLVRYLTTTPTELRGKLLTTAARSPHVTNEELARLYAASGAVDQKAVLEVADDRDERRGFFSLILENGELVKPRYYKHALSATVRKALVGPEATETSRRELFAHGLGDWAAHGPVYLEYLEQLLDEAGCHPLSQGHAYREFEGRIRGKVPLEHVLRLVEICEARQLWVATDPTAFAFYRKQPVSALQAMVFVQSGERPGPMRLFPSAELLKVIPERRALVEMFLERDTSSGQIALREGCAEALGEVLALPVKKAWARAQLQALAVDVLAAASPESVCELLLRSHRVAVAGGVPEMSREAQCLVRVADGAWRHAKMNTEHRDLYNAWKAMLNRCLPAVAVKFLDGRWPSVNSVACLEELWVAAHADKLTAHVKRCKVLLTTAVGVVDRTGSRTGMTSHAGYLAVLCRDLVELGAAADARLTGFRSLAGQLQLVGMGSAMLCACDVEGVWALRGSESDERGAQLLRDGATALLTDLLHRTLRVLETRAPGGIDFPDVANVKAALDTVLEAVKLRGGLQLIRRGGEVSTLFLTVLDRCSEVLRYPQSLKDERAVLRTVGRVGDAARCTVLVEVDPNEPLKQLKTTCEAVLALIWAAGQQQRGLPLHDDVSPEAVRGLWRWWGANALTRGLDASAPLRPTDRRANAPFGPPRPADSVALEADRFLYLHALEGLPASLLPDEQLRAVAVAVRLGLERPVVVHDVLSALKPVGFTAAFVLAARSSGVDVPMCRVEGARGVVAAEEIRGVRELLEESALTSDAKQRMDMRYRLLGITIDTLHTDFPPAERQEQLPLTASVLSQTEAAIRNEMSDLRADLYKGLRKVFALMVSASLEVPDDAAASEFVKSVVGTMLQLVTNDLSKRDSVGAAHFSGFIERIGSVAFGCPPSRKPFAQHLRLDVRAEWLALGLEIEKLLLKKSMGLDRYQEAAHFGTLLRHVKLDANRIVPQRLPWERLEAALVGEGEAVLINARWSWHRLANRLRDTQDVPLAGRDAAALLVAALRKASVVDLLAFRAASAESGWVDQKRLVEGAAERVVEVMSLAGADWASVPEVIEYIGAAGQFLRRVADGALPLPREVAVPVVEVLHQVLRCAVTRSGEYADACTVLRELRWELLRVRLQDASASTAVAVQFLERSARDLTLPGLSEGDVMLARRLCGKVHRVTVARTDLELRRSLMLVNQLLRLTPSAIHLHLVQALLGSNRDDVLGTFIGCTQGDVAGPLGPALRNTGAPLALYLTPGVLKALNSENAQKATRSSLELGLGGESSTEAREAAVTQFVLSPTTGHAAVIGLLGSLLKDDDPTEDSHALVEAVVLQVFKTDGAWHVLKYLLRPAVLQKCAQRTTATVLENLCEWQRSERVVAVLKLLLQSQRREAVGVLLHKKILQLLVEATCSDAAAVLRREWADRRVLQTHVGVVDELVRLAAIRVARSDSSLPPAVRDVLWEILEDAAAKGSGVSVSSRLLLTGLRWVPSVPYTRPRKRLVTPVLSWVRVVDPTAADEALFDLKAKFDPTPPFVHEIPGSDSATHATALRLQALVRKAVDEAPTAELRALGVARPFWLDWRVAGGDVELKTLDEMSALLMHPVDSLAQLQGIDDKATALMLQRGSAVAEAYGAAAKLFLHKRHKETDNPVGQHVAQVVEKLLWSYVRSPSTCTPLRQYLRVVLEKLVEEVGSRAAKSLLVNLEPAKHLAKQQHFVLF